MPRPAIGRAEGVSPLMVKNQGSDALRSPKTARWPIVVGIAVTCVLLLACSGGGIWLLSRWLGHAAEPVVAVNAPAPAAPSPLRQDKQEEPATNKEKTPEEKPADQKPPEKKPPDDKPPPPPPPPPLEEKKDLALADDLPPELEFQIVDAINEHREKAGLAPIFLDAEASRGCRAHAGYLARNAPRRAAEGADRRDEDAKLPGFTEAGRKSARTASIAEEGPLAAIEKWLADPAQRGLILEPRLRTFAAGFARNVAGQWVSVFDWTNGIDRAPPLAPQTVAGAIICPAHEQTRVPLNFPGNETPDPLPEAADKLAGYPVTVMFPPRTRIDSVMARLVDQDERDVDVWLSWPEKPANPKHADAQKSTICLIAKRPLKPDRRYAVHVTAQVNGKPSALMWGFSTVSRGEIHHEMAGKLLRTLNAHRRRAGMRPVALDPERSKACAAHAHYLGVNAPRDPMLHWNEEKPMLPGYSEEGAAIARRASIQGGGGPVEAVTGLVDSLVSRPQVLDPDLHALGLGYTPFAKGGWIWVMDFNNRRRGNAPAKELLYPAPDQKEVPLSYPIDEVPSPVPLEGRGKEAGYAITAQFVTRVKVTGATAKLVDGKGEVVEGWLSMPEKPAIADYPQRSICLIPRSPLKADTRYTVTFRAQVDEKPWERTWSFTTMKKPDRFTDDLDEKILARVNAARKLAGLPLVRLDMELSRGCQAHAHYLSVNAKNPAVRGLAVHREDATLPGATAEGARAARASVIAVILDPQTCVEGWMATLYHRIPILSPDLERIGFGHARMGVRKWACVLDTSGKTTR